MLVKKLREITTRLTGVAGYNTKMVERAGKKLKQLIPNTNPWKGQPCGRGECHTCHQSEEQKVDCRKRNVVYESGCELCNPKQERMEKKKGEQLEDKRDEPSIYVGETSRSLAERTTEHWKDVTNKEEESHMMKHWSMKHDMEGGPPKFRFEVVKFCRTALERQISEATRIALRKNCLNSKSGYNRSGVTRLTLKPKETQL